MRVLSADTDRGEWDATIARLPELWDVHFTSAYGRVQERAGGKAILAVGESGVAQPFLLQPIGDTGFFDLKSLYGFGGPLSATGALYSVQVLGEWWRNELFAWAKVAGIVSEYCCLHPLFAKQQLQLVAKDSVIFTKDVVVIEDLKQFSESKVSRRIRRAIKDTRERTIMIEASDALTFERLYNQSMDRLGAQSRWRFNTAYWEAHLSEPVGAHFIYLLEYHEPRRCLLVVGNGKTAYAHFLGSDAQGEFDPILYFDTARYLARMGYDRFHLGGGLSENEDDPLLFFKSGFSQVRYRVGSYRRIFQPEIYDMLTEKTQGRRSTWFPAYRAGESA